MRKIIAGVLLLGMTLCLCAGCGGEYPASESGRTASGSAVSGNAVSGSAVSGNAVSGSATNGDAAEKSGHFPINKKSSYVNDTNYYEEDDEDGGAIRQMKLDGTFVRSISILENGNVYLMYVTNDEIFYSRYDDNEDNEDITQLWRIPIRKTEDGDEPVAEEAEFILKDILFGSNFFYADENYIVYLSDYSFKVFDRKAGKNIKLKGNPDDKKGMANSAFYMADSMCGDRIIFTCKTKGLYMYTLGSDQVVLVDGGVHGAYTSAAYEGGDQIIYECCENCKGGLDEKQSEHKISLYLYDCKTGEKRKFITEDEWRSIYEKNGILKEAESYQKEEWGEEFEFDPTGGSIYADGDTLYYVLDYFVFRFELKDENGAREPYFERSMSEWMKKQEYTEEFILSFDDGKCYLEDTEYDGRENENYFVHIAYDIQSKTYVKKEFR